MGYRRLSRCGILCALILAAAACGCAQPRIPDVRLSPFAPPLASIHYARSRDYDLRHVELRLKVDWQRKTFGGAVTHTLAPLRDGLRELRFDAGANLRITACRIETTDAAFTHSGNLLSIRAPAALPAGRELHATIVYADDSASGRAQPEAGFHWVKTDPFEPERRPGFWTNGWPENNRYWVPIYDYPNDLATSEVYVEAPAGWYVTHNGVLEGIRENRQAGTRTFHWKMPEPHATYLLALTGGEMDVQTARAPESATRLLFATPRGMGGLIHPSMGRTGEMIRFFSQRLGVRYPWPKYGQSAVFDFVFGGMENVGCTTLTESALVEERNGRPGMDGLVAHELAHQWFGNLITCKDWSHVWLSEGFATFMTMLWAEHDRGVDAGERERDRALQSYLDEAKRYRRPIVTRAYWRPHSLLDSHSYPKAALVLHMLRRELGDDDFFRGIARFLQKHGHQPVDTHDLIAAFAEITGRILEPFFDQWIYRPGHPLIDYRWGYDAERKEIVLEIAQRQDPRSGTPLYRLPMAIAILAEGNARREAVTVDQPVQQFRFAADRPPQSLLIDPDHDLLMERTPRQWAQGEAEVVLRHAPSTLDRQAAALHLFSTGLNDDAAAEVLALMSKDSSAELIASVLRFVPGLNRPALRPLIRQLAHRDEPEIRAAAIACLGNLPADESDAAFLRSLVNERELFAISTAAAKTLSAWNADASLDLFERMLQMDSRREVLRLAGLDAASASRSARALSLFLRAVGPSFSRTVRSHAVRRLATLFPREPRATDALIALLKDADPRVVSAAVASLVARKDARALPGLRDLARTAADPDIRSRAESAADSIGG